MVWLDRLLTYILTISLGFGQKVQRNDTQLLSYDFWDFSSCLTVGYHSEKQFSPLTAGMAI